MDHPSTAAKAFKSLVARACQEGDERNGEKQMMDTLRKMMNNSEFSDLVFLCNDGASLYASRLWLCARSLVFLKGLSPGIKEITLDDISSPVLSIVFEFLYTGSVQPYKSRVVDDEVERWIKGLEVIRASRYLLLPDLENLLWNSLVMDVYESILDKDLTSTSVRLSTLRKMMSEYDSSSDIEIIISLELVRILDRGWLGMLNLTNFSQEALLFLLENTQSENKSQKAQHNVLCLREYLRLRQVLLWCVSQRLDVDTAVKTLDDCVPGAKRALQLLKETDDCNILDRSPKSRRDPEAASILIRASASAGFKSKFLPLISLRLIHPILLVKVLEPLKIISPSKFMEAFRFHALKRSFRTNIHEYTWKHSGCFKVWGDGTLEKSRGPSGTAVLSAPAFWLDRIYEWNVTIDSVQTSNQGRCESEWEVGMVMSNTDEISLESLTNVLSDLNNGWALRRNSQGEIFVKQPGLLMEKPTNCMLYASDPCSETDDISSEIRIGVHLNMFDRTCSFRLNDVDLGLAWTDLPPKYYFPAVSFCSMYGPSEGETSVLGKARVELLDGFEFEQERIHKKPRSVSSGQSPSSMVLESSPDAFQSDNNEVASADGLMI